MRAELTTHNVRGHFQRGAVGIFGMFFGFAGLALLPLADATVISYASPLFVVALAALLLGETVRIYRWSAVLIGFVGVVVAMAPHLFGPNVSPKGAAYALIGAIMAAFAMIEVRKLTRSETTGAIVFYFSLFCTLVGLLTWPLGFIVEGWRWHTPSLSDFALLVMVGVFGGLGQITLTASYRRADASVIAPFEYVSMLWAASIGYLAFREVPEATVAAGSVLVIASGLFVIYRENRLGLERRRQLESTPTRPV